MVEIWFVFKLRICLNSGLMEICELKLELIVVKQLMIDDGQW